MGHGDNQWVEARRNYDEKLLILLQMCKYGICSSPQELKIEFSRLLLVFQHVLKPAWPHKSHHMGRLFQVSSAAKANLEGMSAQQWGGLPGCWVRAFFCLWGCFNSPSVWESYTALGSKWSVNLLKWFSIFCSFHSEPVCIITWFPVFVHCSKPCQVFRVVICDSTTSYDSFMASE